MDIKCRLDQSHFGDKISLKRADGTAVLVLKLHPTVPNLCATVASQNSVNLSKHYYVISKRLMSTFSDATKFIFILVLKDSPSVITLRNGTI